MKPTVSDRITSVPSGSSTPPHRGVERGEEHVLGHDIRAGQTVEERGFPGIRIAHEGDDGIGHLFPRLAVERAGLDHLGQYADGCGSRPRRWPACRPRSGSRRGHQRSPGHRAGVPGGSRPRTQPRALVAERAPVPPATRFRGWRRDRRRFSRIRPVRSSSLTPHAFSRLRCCTGVTGPSDQHETHIERLDPFLQRDRRSCRCRREARAAPWAGGNDLGRMRPRDSGRARGPAPRPLPSAGAPRRGRDRSEVKLCGMLARGRAWARGPWRPRS